MLSGHSFNALLKTLEEPPPHVKFLLATTDPQKLPATILSRCLQFNLRLLSTQEIGGQLEVIARSEGFSFDETGLAILSRAADGSMRDGLSLLDQSIAFGDGSVTGDEVRDMLGMIESHHVDAILLALAGNDGSALIDTVSNMSERPVNYLSALDELLTVFHNVSLFQILPEAAAAKQADSRLVRELASVLGKEDVQLYYQIGLLGKRDLPLAPDPASGFEMTLLRMLTFSPEGEPGLGGDAAESQAKKSVSSSGGQNIGVAREVQPKNSASSNATTPMRRAVAQSGATDKGHLETPSLSDPAVWATFVEDSAFTGVTRELAMNLCPESYDSKNQVLTLSLMPGLASMRSPSRQKSLEKKLEAFYGSSVRVEIAEDGRVSGETPAMVQVRREQEKKDQAFKALMDDPAVQGLVSAFDATAVPESVTPGKQQRKIE